MKAKFYQKQSLVFDNLLFEIRSKEKVVSYGLKTIMPPENLCRDYLEKGDDNSAGQLKKWLADDLKKNKFGQKIKMVKKNWRSVEDDFFIELTKMVKRDIFKKYHVCPTLYGPGGSYQMPDKIFIRLVTKEDLDYATVNIAHEIIHLNVEDVVRRKNLSHDDKELLVNSIMFQPGIARILEINNEEIKKSKYYNNLDKILRYFHELPLQHEKMKNNMPVEYFM